MLISVVRLFCHKNSLFIFLFKSAEGIGTGKIMKFSIFSKVPIQLTKTI